MYTVPQYQAIEPYPYIQAQNYQSKENIVETFPHLKNINTNRDWSSKKNVDGIIIRSGNDDNIHKSIKYGIWTTTSKNRTKLNQIYTRARLQNKEVYLFFSVVKSGMFEGVARLTSGFTEENFPFWWDDFSMKFKGCFKLEWVYLKDVNFRHFDGLYNTDNEEVIKSKDCDMVDPETTLKMLNLFQNKSMKNKWIFNDFPFMDKRQKQYTRRLQQQNYQGYNMGAEYQNFMAGNMNPMGNYGMAMNTQYMNYSPQMMPFPPQMMKPNNQSPSHTSLGFQMNPVSYKNKRK